MVGQQGIEFLWMGLGLSVRQSLSRGGAAYVIRVSRPARVACHCTLSL